MDTLFFEDPIVAYFCHSNDINQLCLIGKNENDELQDISITVLAKFSKNKNLSVIKGKLSELIGCEVDLLEYFSADSKLRKQIILQWNFISKNPKPNDPKPNDRQWTNVNQFQILNDGTIKGDCSLCEKSIENQNVWILTDEKEKIKGKILKVYCEKCIGIK